MMNSNQGQQPESVPLNQCKKIFIHRDYSHGLDVKFQSAYPEELRGRLDENLFAKTVRELNALYVDAERVGGRSVFETMLSCVTCHMAQMCMTTQYQKHLKLIVKYIADQNEQVFQPRGLWISDPIERGLRNIEISILDEPAQRVT